MDNNYESLLDERFQMLCQSLLTLEYPGVQCMPVGMPDGGRDALVRGRSGGSTLVYQIKYTRDPSGVEDRAQWVIDAISKELPKVARLAEAGDVERYVIMTNMPGTSHLKSGSIDRVQAFLDENSPVPSICLWRHDIDMRLDPHIQLKLRYPSLISGQDAIRLLWHLGGANESRARRENAINAYLNHHYNQDKKVRFKEVGLSSNSLFDLYIDVPGWIGQRHRRRSNEIDESR